MSASANNPHSSENENGEEEQNQPQEEQHEDVAEEENEEESSAELKAAVDAALGDILSDDPVAVPHEAPESAVIEEYEMKLAEMKDQMLRAAAEAENARRRAARDVEESSKYAVSGFARDLLGVAENLQLALQSVPAEQVEGNDMLKNLVQGVEMTQRELLNVFERHGIKRVDPLGEKFDHNFHQAVSQMEDPSKEPGTVVQVLQAGYVLRDRLLRPAMVVVAKQGSASGGDQPRVDTQV